MRELESDVVYYIVKLQNQLHIILTYCEFYNISKLKVAFEVNNIKLTTW